MNDNQTLRRSRQRGYSLIEILVAMTIFTTVVLAALLLYDRSNKVFKQSMEAGDMQQSTRVAFDRLVADLRLSGYDFDRDGRPMSSIATTWKAETDYTIGMLVQPATPNGHTYVAVASGKSDSDEPTWPEGTKEQVDDGSDLKWEEAGAIQYQQPDEQIEYAGAHAITVRGNFDYETETGPCLNATDPCENGREPKYQSTSEFQVVTTGNDEIVTYALKPVAWAAGETADELVFYADVSIPRDVHPASGKEEAKITISGVDLCTNGCNSPPYTLYRYTIGEDGNPDAGTPIAENIRSMTFRYFDAPEAREDDPATGGVVEGDEIIDLPDGDGPYDGGEPDKTVEERDVRASIRAIEVALTGMNPQPDPDFTDPADAVAPHHRKLDLRSLIVPRNIGRRGMKEFNAAPPQPPVLKSVCTGACNAVYLTWAAPTAGGDIDSYAILHGTDPCVGGAIPTGGFQYSEEVGLHLEGSIGRFITEPSAVTEWYFAVQAINKYGSQVSNCMGPVTVFNKTKPAALAELHASHPTSADYPQVEGGVDLYFSPAGANTPGQDVIGCFGGGNVTQTQMPSAENRYYEVFRSKDPMFKITDSGVVKVLDAGTSTQPVSTGTLMRWRDTGAASCSNYYYRVRVVDYCARKNTYNDGSDLTLAQSPLFPDETKAGINGQAKGTGIAPAAPILTLTSTVCSGASGNCDLTFTWSAVTKDVEGNDTGVGSYFMTVEKWDAVKDAYLPDTPKSEYEYDGSVTTATFSVVQSDPSRRYKLHAENCLPGGYSNVIIYPCEFNGGDVGMTIGNFGGSGTAVEPYVVEAPTTVVVSTDADVEKIQLSVFVDGTPVGDIQEVTGTIQTATFTLPELPENQPARVLATVVDSKGCTAYMDAWVSDSPAPACQLSNTGNDSTLLTVNKTNVVLTLENIGDEDLTVKNVYITWTPATKGSGASEISSVTFGTTAQAVACAKGSVNVAAPTGQVVAAGTSTYQLTINTNAANLGGNSQISSICVVYQASTGDLVTCQVHGSGGCTVPGSACE